MNRLLALLFFICPFLSNGQAGTAADPFPTLGHSLTVTSAGVYYFDLGGVTFNTYVDINGYVLVAIDFGDGVGSLPQVSALDLTARGVLTPTVLASLTDASEARISTSSGNIDAVSLNTTILTRIVNNETLHRGMVDNAINDFWTGTNSTWLTGDAVCTGGGGMNLEDRVFHVCGAAPNCFHWQPYLDQQRERWLEGEVTAAESFHLWVRDFSVLPIELLEFNATPMKDEHDVLLEWVTASESNNDYFTIERSRNALDWDSLFVVDGAGNSSEMLDYTDLDPNPYPGVSYYRLKQTDFDGNYSYSGIRSVNFEGLDIITVYPNPSNGYMHMLINSKTDSDATIHVHDVTGRVVYSQQIKVTANVAEYFLDLTGLATGAYSLKVTLTDQTYYDQINIQIR